MPRRRRRATEGEPWTPARVRPALRERKYERSAGARGVQERPGEGGNPSATRARGVGRLHQARGRGRFRGGRTPPGPATRTPTCTAAWASSGDRPSGLNSLSCSNPEVDRLLAAVRTESRSGPPAPALPPHPSADSRRRAGDVRRSSGRPEVRPVPVDPAALVHDSDRRASVLARLAGLVAPGTGAMTGTSSAGAPRHPDARGHHPRVFLLMRIAPGDPASARRTRRGPPRSAGVGAGPAAPVRPRSARLRSDRPLVLAGGAPGFRRVLPGPPPGDAAHRESAPTRLR